MKQSIKLILREALLLALPLFLTSCDDILGQWDKPAPAVVTPTPEPEPEPEAPVKVTGITLNKTTTSMLIGGTETLNVTAVAPDDATDKTYKWSSNDKSVVTVDDNGVVTAVALGTATIIATANDGSGVEGTCNVTVDGLLKGVFSVSASKKVRFAQGNLQATSTGTSGSLTWTWTFAANQWGYNTAPGSAYYTELVNGDPYGPYDLFHWVGTTGTPTTEPAKYGLFNPGDNDCSQSTTDVLKYPWGELIGSGWTLLSDAEFSYLLSERTASTVGSVANGRFAKAYLFGSVHGLILFPDSYTHPDGVTAPTGVNATDATSWDANQYNVADWAKMETAGAVFLPAGGMKNQPGGVNDVGSEGYYWTSTHHSSNWGMAIKMGFKSDGGPGLSGLACKAGCSVRLIQEVPAP